MVTAADVLPVFSEWFITAIRNLNSALYVAKDVPDWRQKYHDAQNNPLLHDQVERIAVLVREIVESALGNRDNDPEFYSRLEKLGKELQKPPD